jgi:predicted transcriptional regulator
MTVTRQTAHIVSAYLETNQLAAQDIPALVRSIHATLATIGQPVVKEAPKPKSKTAAEIRRSITDDGLISFVDGRPYKTLRRHLTTNGMTPDGYRTKYGLPADYPLTAPSYSRTRSDMAKAFGLGAKGRRTPNAKRTRKA